MFIIYGMSDKVHLILNILIKYILQYYVLLYKRVYDSPCENITINNILMNLDDRYITHNINHDIEERNEYDEI
jgi:hypothetical protein